MNPKVVQDLPRHASYQLIKDVYDSVVFDEKREAHSGVIRPVADNHAVKLPGHYALPYA